MDGRWFDDLTVGMSEVSPRRTIGEADVAAFAGLSGDFNPLHVDRTYAERGQFGERIAHGLLGAVIASGLFTSTALSRSLQGALVAMLATDVHYRGPIRFGDTIRVEAEITELRESSKGDRGVVTIERRVLNQDDEVVQTIVTPMLVRKVPR